MQFILSVVKILKRKRLDRDSKTGGWGFEGHPYYQMRVDIEEFHGLVCLIKLISGKYYYWGTRKTGKTAVCGKGMTWLQLIPDGKSHILTAKYLPKRNILQKIIQGIKYSDSVSIWYTDIIENIEYDEDGVAVFVDKYLDVIFNPAGGIKIDDRDELDEAFQSGDVSKEQYDSALRECDLIIEEYCSDIAKTENWCNKILSHVNDRIRNGEKQFKHTL